MLKKILYLIFKTQNKYKHTVIKLFEIAKMQQVH